MCRGQFCTFAFGIFQHTFTAAHRGSPDRSQQALVAPGVRLRVGAVPRACGVEAVHRPADILLLRDPDVGGEDLDGQGAL